ncbi:hypothetical protein [Pseudomonas sp. PSKL.D1]|uniref:hypothetical protein n=1 Tax=Pseudomonas sp. PSKL.D1 TaxID=3029060 RepID=UPI002380E3BE|nr:hypothetical protein [Pseudomonas sp. PSKL.D1]WDY60283.1 hypothetical protein PVV54_11850 [Pseudomonas sp. PSKL.D1]
MKFKDMFVSRQHMFSIGIEEEAEQHFVSFPVSNGLVDYEEYYAIDAEAFERFLNAPDAALAFVIKCRHREMDELLIIKPGTRRGTGI